MAVDGAPQITATAEGMRARIDVAASHAHRALEGRSTLPQLRPMKPGTEIDAGRRPVVEAALRQSGDRFVANDLLDRPATISAVADHRTRDIEQKSTSCGKSALIAVLD